MQPYPLDQLQLELPTWAFGDASAQPGRFPQAAAARNLREILGDAALVHRLTGCCPRLAVRFPEDFPDSAPPAAELAGQARVLGLKFGAVHPQLSRGSEFRFGALASPDPAAREAAFERCRQAVDLMQTLGSQTMTLRLADGIGYPGQDDFLLRKARMKDGLRRVHEILTDVNPNALLLIEYRGFTPTRYSADLADWGSCLLYCQSAGGRAKVLINPGRHLPGQNVEQIVTTLLDERQLGGFAFSDRRQDEDDLSFGSLDPYAVFRIFHELQNDALRRSGASEGPQPLVLGLDQSNHLKPKLEAIVQTVDTLQRLWLKAVNVERTPLALAQQAMDVIAAETILRRAFDANVDEDLHTWRRDRGLPEDPLAALREGDEIPRRERDRGSHFGPLSRSQRVEVRTDVPPAGGNGHAAAAPDPAHA